MSYEGSQEWLCANGHYLMGSCWDAELTVCPRCHAPITHRHSIDETNGPDESDPSTLPAPKEQIGTEDDWHTDHHGNRYAVLVRRYKPVAEWRTMTAPKENQSDALS